MELQYLASRSWMESEILAGNAVQSRRQSLVFEVEALSADLAKRVDDIRDAFEFVLVRKQRRVCVLDSGIDPEQSFGPAPKKLKPLDDEIVEKVGRLPELPSPTTDISTVVKAWEGWLAAYIEAARGVIERLNAVPPPEASEAPPWADGVEVQLSHGVSTTIKPSDGTEAILAARAGDLWEWASAKRYSAPALRAAREAVYISPTDARGLLEIGTPSDVARASLDLVRRRCAAAKAFDAAQEAAIPDFEAEMKRWAKDHGSERLRLGLEDGYRMNSRYLAERIAAEAPGMFAMPSESAKKGWAIKTASPSESALRLRRQIAAAMERNAPPNSGGPPETEISTVKSPPPEIYRADAGIQTPFATVGTDLPSRDGWPWELEHNRPVSLDPIPFEAVVVKNWLGRFHLIGAVDDDRRGAPPGIWAVPDIDDYRDDGSVLPRDPDETMPERAKRKPPERELEEDDIPF